MSFATTAQLATYLGVAEGTLPTDATRLLSRATELIQDTTLAAMYDTDSAGNATVQKVIDAFMNATCAQVEFWLTGDEEDDISGPLESMSTGGQGQGYGSGSNRPTPMYLAPRAARHLRIGGLLTSTVGDAGSSGTWNGQSVWVGP